MSSRRQVVIDSNLVIYAAADPLGVAARFLRTVEPVVSAITMVEVLGFPRLTVREKAALEESFAAATVVAIEDAIVQRAIAIRQSKKTSLGDAIIAATALEYGLELATRNVADFRWIAALRVIDPFAAAPAT